jgi:hypothetical protein
VEFRDEVTGALWRVHGEAQCKGEPCCIHNPSDHKMKSWPRHIRETGLVERMCPHGVGHPDPDSVAFIKSATGEECWSVHGCDGCCTEGARP